LVRSRLRLRSWNRGKFTAPAPDDPKKAGSGGSGSSSSSATLGASNEKEIFRSFLKYKRQVPNAVPKITSIRSHCVPGTKYPELIWPIASELGKDDVLLILSFGNELQKGKYIRDSTPSRTFHLINFVPELSI